MTDIEAVASAARDHLIWLVIMPVISVWCYALDGIFIGAGQARLMRNSMLLSVLAGFLPAWWLFRDLGNHGLWLAFALFNVFRGASLAAAYAWLTRRRAWIGAS